LQKINPGPKHQETLHTMYSLALRYHSLDRFEDSLELHQQTWALRKDTLGPNHRDTLYSMWGVATNMLKVDRGSEAVPIIDECLQRAAGTAVASNFSGLADKRLRYFEMAKDAAGCQTTAEIWERMHCTDSDSLYHAARYRAVTAKVLRKVDTPPDALKQAEAEADKAMVWLRQAVAAGYANLKNIKQDTDLDALRDRADFHLLVADLEASKAKK
jgi:hypothetical protein